MLSCSERVVCCECGSVQPWCLECFWEFNTPPSMSITVKPTLQKELEISSLSAVSDIVVRGYQRDEAFHLRRLGPSWLRGRPMMEFISLDRVGSTARH